MTCMFILITCSDIRYLFYGSELPYYHINRQGCSTYIFNIFINHYFLLDQNFSLALRHDNYVNLGQITQTTLAKKFKKTYSLKFLKSQLIFQVIS
jgi:hypothetical protein